MRLEITFKSGSTIQIDVASYRYDGPRGKFSWERSPDGRGLVKLDLEEVVAIVQCDGPAATTNGREAP